MSANAANWGIADAEVATLWPQTIRILFVIDGRIRLTKAANAFGLGYVLDTLRAPFAWWVRFEVDVARRDDFDGVEPLTYRRFKFTDAGFNLDAYDQLWFFADLPNIDDGADDAMTDADICNEFALSHAELKLVAEWMDRGGGVFATGDHTLLGASMCSRIPRVGTMRRWTYEQGVPPRDAAARHETLQPNPNTVAETDTLLQPLELVYRHAGTWPFLGPLVPHPLLQTAQGVIDRFPDHMHEGEVIADDEVRLDRPLDIPGYDRPEYPPAPGVLASALDGVALPPQRPRPRVVAYGRTTNAHFPEPEIAPLAALLPGFGDAGSLGLTKRFGLVGAYDGDSVGVGRVVVDSTWHHWLSINIHAIANAETPVVALKASSFGTDSVRPQAYKNMQTYYRNVGLWLATPAQRRSMLISSLWGVLVGSPPMQFSTADDPWRIGERALAILGRDVPRGVLAELVSACVPPQAFVAAVPRPVPGAEPAWSSMQADPVNRALVGGISSALLRPALEHRAQRDRGLRPRLDAETIRRRALEGVSRGHTLLRQWIDDAAVAIGAIKANLRAPGAQPPIDVNIPAAVRRLRVIATVLQLPDARDPALIAGHVTATVRLRLGDDVVANRTFERVKLPSFEARGAVIDLSRDIGEVEAHAWERLSVEVLAGAWSPQQPVDPEAVRFEDTLPDDAAVWIGEHSPARSQAWRLWYRIEDVAGPAGSTG